MGRRHPLLPLIDHLYLPRYKSPTDLLDMHHLTCGINSLLRSMNFFLFTLLLVHLILRASPHQCHHSAHVRSHHLSLPRPLTPELKLISLRNFSTVVFLVPFGLSSRITDLDRTKWTLAFVC